MSLIAIIIPCFNEQQRLAPVEITNFLSTHPLYYFFFVDDGSADNTGLIIDDLKKANESQVNKLEFKTNKGKANAVREGFRCAILEKKYSHIGYWDADMSTSFTELQRMTRIVQEQHLDFAFGSRMKKMNALIHRSGFRHLTGRVITTVIDTRFKLGIYDTQCGAKLFSAALADIISNEPFVTSWLFDVEIFLRIRNLSPEATGEEIPLKSWISRSGSKITILTAPSLLLQFIKLLRAYPVKQKIDE